MLDPEAPSSRLALEEMRKPLQRPRLVRTAAWWTQSRADADDLVNAALARVLDPEDEPWVPAKRSFRHHMTNVMRDMWCEEMRKARVQREIVDYGLAHDENRPALDPAADDHLHQLRTLALWQSLVEEALREIGEKHPVVRQMHDLIVRGVDEPAEQAGLIGCPVAEVYAAVQTLRYHARRARDAWELAERQRMRDLQARATRKDRAVS